MGKSKSLTTSINEDPDPSTDGQDDGPPDPTLFEGKCPIEKAWWINRVFFAWLNPLIKFSMKHGVLKFENYGHINPKDQVSYQIERLRTSWENKVATRVTKNTLIRAIFSCYKWDLVYLMSCNFCSICLMFCQPFFLNYIIDYVNDGENKVYDWGIHFYDFSNIEWMKWLTTERQYGLSLGLCLLLTQFFKFMIDENVTYANAMFAGRSSNALIGLIYEK